MVKEDWTPDSVNLSMQVDDFVYISDGAYTKQQLLAMVFNHFHLHHNAQQCFPISIPFLSFNLLIEAELESMVFFSCLVHIGMSLHGTHNLGLLNFSTFPSAGTNNIEHSAVQPDGSNSVCVHGAVLESCAC